MNINHRCMLKVGQAIRETRGYRASYAAVYNDLAYLENAKTGTCCPAQAVLARRLGYCRETVNRACRWLAKHGFIQLRHRYRRRQMGGVRILSNVYRVAKDPEHVAWLLSDYAKRARAAWSAGLVGPFFRASRVTWGAHPHQVSVLNPVILEARRSVSVPPAPD